MKKIIIMLISIMLLTSCYDNVELDDLSIITSIGIDYIDNKYIVNYEILNDNKSDNSTELLSYTINGYGNNISEAFLDANKRVNKRAYFAHVKLMVLSENITGNIFKNIIDYLLRNTEIRNEFQVVVSNNTTPLEILSNNSKKHPVVSNLIIGLLDNEKYNSGLANNETFLEIVAKLISNNDIILNSISIIDDEISLDNSYIYNGYNIKNKLTTNDSKIYNLLKEKSLENIFINYYNNDSLIISINKEKVNINVESDKIIISSNLEAKIVENNSKIDFKNKNSYYLLENDFNIIISNSIKDFIKILQYNKTDILGFKDIYYKKYNKDNKNLWINADIIVNTNLKINNSGFIFEANHE